jgi:hypothetical protein
MKMNGTEDSVLEGPMASLSALATASGRADPSALPPLPPVPKVTSLLSWRLSPWTLHQAWICNWKCGKNSVILIVSRRSSLRRNSSSLLLSEDASFCWILFLWALFFSLQSVVWLRISMFFNSQIESFVSQFFADRGMTTEDCSW